MTVATGAVLALGLGAAGCGGDDSSADATRSTTSSTSSTSTSSTSTTAASTSTSGKATTTTGAAGARLSLGGLAGDWEGHGRSISVHDDGTFDIDYRTYRDCDTDPEPCDQVVGDQLFDGGHAEGRLSSGVTPEWHGTLTESNDESVFPRGPVTITKDPDQDLIHVRAGRADDQTFCGPDVVDSPCGA